MKAQDIISDLKQKKYAACYFLMGEEPFYIDMISNYITDNVLTEEEKGFNQTILYGRDTDALTIMNEAKRFPAMSEHQVVVVREAQYLNKIEELQPYFEKANQSTILVICYKYKKLDKRKTFYKAVNENAIVFDSEKLYDNQVPAWITSYLGGKKYKINPKATMLLAQFLGNDLSKIANELDKLMLNLEGRMEINENDIEQNIGISKDYNNFELVKALGEKDIFRANAIATYFENNPKNNPMIVTISVLYNFFSKILTYHFINDKSSKNVASQLKVSPFFVKDYIEGARNYQSRKTVTIVELLREYDLKSKGVGNSSIAEGALLKELIFKILH
ncbi:MAG: DNA polymerase III subunit delta [Bacteroidetes bacterium]|nr:DNA polymerase III subunit delta [Bacteroidota bacterium]